MDEGSIDRDAMGKMAKALAFISGEDHPMTLAMRKAAETQSQADIKAARQMFLQLKPATRASALAFLKD